MMGHGHWSDSQDSSAWFFPAAVDINSGKDWLLWEIYIRVLEISNKIIKNIFIVVKHDWKFAKKHCKFS